MVWPQIFKKHTVKMAIVRSSFLEKSEAIIYALFRRLDIYAIAIYSIVCL